MSNKEHHPSFKFLAAVGIVLGIAIAYGNVRDNIFEPHSTNNSFEQDGFHDIDIKRKTAVVGYGTCTLMFKKEDNGSYSYTTRQPEHRTIQNVTYQDLGQVAYLARCLEEPAIQKW